jgi:hypothetical protein
LGVEWVLEMESADIVRVQGDTNTVMSVALAAVKFHGKIEINNRLVSLENQFSHFRHQFDDLVDDSIGENELKEPYQEKGSSVSNGVRWCADYQGVMGTTII